MHLESGAFSIFPKLFCPQVQRFQVSAMLILRRLDTTGQIRQTCLHSHQNSSKYGVQTPVCEEEAAFPGCRDLCCALSKSGKIAGRWHDSPHLKCRFLTQLWTPIFAPSRVWRSCSCPPHAVLAKSSETSAAVMVAQVRQHAATASKCLQLCCLDRHHEVEDEEEK